MTSSDRAKRKTENNGRIQENKFGNQGGRCGETAGQNHTARIRKQHDEIRKRNRSGKQESESRREKIRKMGATTVLFCPQTGEVKEGRAPFTPLFRATNRREGRPRSFQTSFHPFVFAKNREVKEGRGLLF